MMRDILEVVLMILFTTGILCVLGLIGYALKLLIGIEINDE